MENDIAEPPNGWAWATYEQIGKWSGGGTPNKRINSYWTGGEIPWISPKDMKTLRVYDSEDKITDAAINNSPAKLIPSGSLLFVVRSGILRRTLPVALIKIDAAVNQDLKALTTSENIFDEYILYHALAFNEEIRRSCTKDGTTVESIEFSALKNYPVPLAPLPEQRRIVARIEELFSRLDAGIDALQRAKAQLRRYRQAVLKAAVEGRLTEDWRKAHPEVEPATILLENIRETKTDFKQLNFENDEDIELSSLPKSWIWTRLGQIFGVYVGATPRRNKPEYWGGDIPWVSSGEVAFCRIYRTRETISKHGFENSSTKIHPPGTVLLGMIGEGKTRGQAAILNIAACNNQNSAAIRVSEVGFPPEYLYYYLEHEYERTRKLSSGNNQPALNKKRVQSMHLPLPPLVEQQKIVEEIERCLSANEEIKNAINESLQRANCLRQSILKRAFEGRLVPQDPGDEPASVLLERIRAEREVETGKRGKKNSSGCAKQTRITQ